MTKKWYGFQIHRVLRDTSKIMLQTERLLLRQWTDDDFASFAEICADKEVMEYFPSPLAEDESFDTGSRIQSLIHERGWGFWAVEIPNQARFIGFVGLHTPKQSLTFSPCVEIGWRLAKAYWNQGYATEAARESLRYGFTKLGLNEIVSFTTVANVRSQAVMKKIGMSDTGRNFMHPDIDVAHPQCEHVLYKIRRPEWES